MYLDDGYEWLKSDLLYESNFINGNSATTDSIRLESMFLLEREEGA